MSTHTRTPPRVQLRAIPLALGTFLATVTALVLFDDVRHGAEITTSHALSLAALVAALASGHMAWPQLKAWRILPGLALTLLFAASTLYVVVSSGTRNAETAAAKTARADEAQRQRGDIARMRREAETILATCAAGTPAPHIGVRCGLRDAMTAECGSGKGSRCTGRTYSVTTYEAAIAGYDAQLAALGPPPAPSGYAHAARVFAALPGITASADDIAQRLALLLPFLAVLICELGTLVFLHLGIASDRESACSRARESAGADTASDRQRSDRPSDSEGVNRQRQQSGQQTTVRDSSQASFAAPDDSAARLSAFLSAPLPDAPPDAPQPTPPGPGKRRTDGRSNILVFHPAGRSDAPSRRETVLASLQADIAAGRSTGSQVELGERHGVPRSTLSDWLREWEAAGLIPPRLTSGRCKVVGGCQSSSAA